MSRSVESYMRRSAFILFLASALLLAATVARFFFGASVELPLTQDYRVKPLKPLTEAAQLDHVSAADALSDVVQILNGYVLHENGYLKYSGRDPVSMTPHALSRLRAMFLASIAKDASRLERFQFPLRVATIPAHTPVTLRSGLNPKTNLYSMETLYSIKVSTYSKGSKVVNATNTIDAVAILERVPEIRDGAHLSQMSIIDFIELAEYEKSKN